VAVVCEKAASLCVCFPSILFNPHLIKAGMGMRPDSWQAQNSRHEGFRISGFLK
jgi:hypothetical protein